MTLKARKKAGDEVIARYSSRVGNDKYAAAVDAIADILLAISETDADATKILHAAEIDFRNAAEVESFVSEG
jgi:predicted transcriptional regulator